MPNIKSAIKRVGVTRIKTVKNTAAKSELRTAIKGVKNAIAQNNDNASESLEYAVKMIDKAAAKNLIHKNTAARKKSRLTRALNKSLAKE